MSEKRRGLGRGLGALIPTGLEPRQGEGTRPVDVFFPDRSAEVAAEQAGNGSGGIGAPGKPLTSRDVVDSTADGSTGTDGDPSEAASTVDGTGSDQARPAGVTSPDGLVPVPGATFAELPVDQIRPNSRQPRTEFDQDALDELVASIQEVGVLQPIVVRPAEDGFELIMGERRWRATQAAGLSTIPAIIRQTEDADLLRDALLENLHRSQLNPLEEAAAYQQLLDDFDCTHDELASRIHRSRPQISNTLRLLRLPPLVQRRVAAGVLSAGHARALLGLSDGAAIERLAQRIVAEGLSVRAVEEIVALGGEGGAKRQTRRPRAGLRNEALDDLAGRLSDRFETRVKVDLGRSRGKLTVEFASVQDLNRILATLAPEDPGLLRG
ncbi:MAG TPA: ParB/RepB/Spo0J family partition protein [Cellulomonas sp.]